jgi:hypothetical protein
LLHQNLLNQNLLNRTNEKLLRVKNEDSIKFREM